MKEYLIRITGERNLFYDSEDRLYRYRMNCPYCDNRSDCKCFDTLEKAENFIENDFQITCSSKCFLMTLIDDQGIDDIRDTMWEMGFNDWYLIKSRFKRFIVKYITNIFTIWRLKWYIFKYTGYISEKDAYEVLDTMGIEFDSIEGESC